VLCSGGPFDVLKGTLLDGGLHLFHWVVMLVDSIEHFP
jgi:hypothetical protein